MQENDRERQRKNRRLSHWATGIYLWLLDDDSDKADSPDLSITSRLVCMKHVQLWEPGTLAFLLLSN